MSSTDISHKKVVHGGLDPVEISRLGLDIEKVVDFSSNINPLGTPEEILQSLTAETVGRYPEPHAESVSTAIAKELGVTTDSVVCGSGAVQLIHTAASIFSGTEATALIVGPTFGEYEAACRSAGLHAVELTSKPENQFRPEVDLVVETIEKNQPAILFVCNPNNPVGSFLPDCDLERFATALGPSGLMVVDESYMSLSDPDLPAGRWDRHGNILSIHSMTKDFAMPGLRTGYAVGYSATVKMISDRIPSWSVSGPAQAAMRVALRLDEHVAAGRATVLAERNRFERFMTKNGIEYVPSTANFVLAKTGDAPSVRLELLKRGLCVRDCTSFGLPEYIRVAMRNPREMDRLMDSLAELL